MKKHIILSIIVSILIVGVIWLARKPPKEVIKTQIVEKIIPKTITKVVEKLVQSQLPPPMNMLPTSIKPEVKPVKYWLVGGINFKAYPKPMIKPEITASAYYLINEKARLYVHLSATMPTESLKQNTTIKLGVMRQF